MTQKAGNVKSVLTELLAYRFFLYFMGMQTNLQSYIVVLLSQQQSHLGRVQ